MKYLLITLLVSISPLPNKVSEGVYTFGGKDGVQLLSPCGKKDVNLDFDTVWEPTHGQVAAIEIKLINYLKSIDYYGLTLPELHRQYVGFTKGEKSYIYGNFYKWESSRGEDDAFEPIIICDGGTDYWVIVFDIKEFKFNGPFYNAAFN